MPQPRCARTLARSLKASRALRQAALVGLCCFVATASGLSRSSSPSLSDDEHAEAVPVGAAPVAEWIARAPEGHPNAYKRRVAFVVASAMALLLTAMLYNLVGKKPEIPPEHPPKKKEDKPTDQLAEGKEPPDGAETEPEEFRPETPSFREPAEGTIEAPISRGPNPPFPPEDEDIWKPPPLPEFEAIPEEFLEDDEEDDDGEDDELEEELLEPAESPSPPPEEVEVPVEEKDPGIEWLENYGDDIAKLEELQEESSNKFKELKAEADQLQDEDEIESFFYKIESELVKLKEAKKKMEELRMSLRGVQQFDSLELLLKYNYAKLEKLQRDKHKQERREDEERKEEERRREKRKKEEERRRQEIRKAEQKQKALAATLIDDAKKTLDDIESEIETEDLPPREAAKLQQLQAELLSVKEGKKHKTLLDSINLKEEVLKFKNSLLNMSERLENELKRIAEKFAKNHRKRTELKYEAVYLDMKIRQSETPSADALERKEEISEEVLIELESLHELREMLEALDLEEAAKVKAQIQEEINDLMQLL